MNKAEQAPVDVRQTGDLSGVVPRNLLAAEALSESAPFDVGFVSCETDAVGESSASPRLTLRIFLVSIALSVIVHIGAVVAIYIWERPPKAQEPKEPVSVDLVREAPPTSKAAPRSALQDAQATDSARPDAPPPTQQTKTLHAADAQPPTLREPPPEPAPAKSSRPPPVKANAAPIAPNSPEGEAAASSAQPEKSDAAPAAAPPLFTMPGEFFSNPLNGQGNSQSESYKGLVYGLIGRAQSFPDSAKRNHESGKAVVAFTLDDRGAIVSLSLAQTSGYADLDAEALAMIQRVAPFPPPPAGAQRSFAAAIIFGED